MAKSFAVTASFTATLSLSSAGVDEYIRAIRESTADGELKQFGDKLVALLELGDGDAALALLFKQGIRAGIRDLTNQLNTELCQDEGKFRAAPAVVSVTTLIKQKGE